MCAQIRSKRDGVRHFVGRSTGDSNCTQKFAPLVVAVMVLALAVAACRAAPVITATPQPTKTPAATPTVAATATLPPTATALPTATTTPPISVSDQIDIYAAVLRRLYRPGETFDPTLNATTIYIMRVTDDAAAGSEPKGSVSVVLAEAVQNGITVALADLPSMAKWVDKLENVPRDSQTGRVIGGILLNLGNIAVQPDGRAFVPGSLYAAPLDGTGGTFVVEKQGGGWRVTGTTGPQWIS